MALPVVVLQMQRMGDLILTFPLVHWLRGEFPDSPILVVAEPSFSGGLSGIGPEVAYCSWDMASRLIGKRFRLVVNLSHRPEAAELAGRLHAEERIGPVRTGTGATYIHGKWQLYRASLVGNNRHNRFHWADLNGLDVVPLSRIAATAWKPPVGPTPGASATSAGPALVAGIEARAIGLFLGASEEAKRPSAVFWAGLVRELLARDLRPVLLGGEGERALAAEVIRLAEAPALDMAGKLNLAELAAVLRSLQLTVTPDTGPMHLAAWIGARVLNLSMGPVNPWETGPYQPGHVVLRPGWSCAGCWTCLRSTDPSDTGPAPCRTLFLPARVAGLVGRMILDSGEKRGQAGLARLRLPGLDLLRTDRGKEGLYRLRPFAATPADSIEPVGAGETSARPDRCTPSARPLLGRFWHGYFGHVLGLWPEREARAAFVGLAEAFPGLAGHFASGLARLGGSFAQAARTDVSSLDRNNFWKEFPPFLRPFTGYAHLVLQNHDFSRQGLREAADLWERLAQVARRS